MFSKIVARGFCLLLLVASAGCGLKVGDSQSVPPAINTNFGSSTACLSDTAPAFGKFFEGSAQPAQVNQMWDCFGTAVDTFEKYTHGRYEDRFTSRELANFVEKYFLKANTHISDALITEVFRIKRMLVGGDESYISRVEMKNLVNVIGELKRISIEILPYMRIYSLNWKVGNYSTIDQDIQYFETANLEIRKAAADLATLIEDNGQSYPLDSFVTLVTEVQNLEGGNWSWISTVKNAMPLVQKLKQTLSGGDGNVVAPTEWRQFALLGSRAYIQYLRFHYFIRDFDVGGAGPQLIYVMKSIDDLFSYLGDMVDGKPDKVLTRQELLEICQAFTNFFPSLNVTDHLLIEAMKVKVVFFGGQIDRFVKADFDRAREKLKAFQTLSEKFLTYIPVYVKSWNISEMSPDQAQAYFQNADTNLTEVGRRLGQIMEAKYDLNDLIQLAIGIDELHLETGDHTFQSLAIQYVPLLISAKNLEFADQDSILGKQTGDWSDFLQLGTKAYSRYLYYYYFLRTSDSLLSGSALGSLSMFVRQSLDLVDQLIARRPSNPIATISFTELSGAWTSVIKANFLPGKISQKTLDDLTKVILQKMFIHPELRLANKLPNGLTQEATKTLREEFGMWLEGQTFMDLMYQGLPIGGTKTPAQVLSDIGHAAPTDELKELKRIFSGPVPLTYDDQDRIHLGGSAINYSRETMNWINLSRSLVRLVLRSYVMDATRIANYTGMTVQEADTLYADIRPVITESNFFDLRNNAFMESRFRDANLFTPRGNGDTYVDFNETTELVMMLLSGVRVDGLISPLVQTNCPLQASTTGYADDATFDVTCFQKNYRQQIPQTFLALPDFLKFMKSLPEDRAAETLINLMKAAGYVPDATGRVKLGDTALVPHVAQYMESLFTTYDRNHDGVLDSDELEKMYPRFENLLKTVGNLKSEHLVKALFFWLIHYGKAPETTLSKIKFITWWAPRKSWDVSADRETFALILGYIADQMAKTPKTDKVVIIPDDMQDNPGHYQHPGRPGDDDDDG